MCSSDLNNVLARNTGPQFSAEQTYAPIVSEWPKLRAAEVHVWYACLSEFQSELECFERMISSDERDRAGRFRFFRDRQNFLLRRGILRLLLSKYISQAPQDIVFRYGFWGKPELEAPETREGLTFNVSHSQGFAVYAMSYCGPIGIDVEERRNIPDLEHIVNQFFSEREAKSLMSRSIESRLDAFLAGWTRKEAILKARGKGVGEELAKIEVSAGQPGICSLTDRLEHAFDWYLSSFSPLPRYIACLATRDRPERVALSQLTNKILQ